MRDATKTTKSRKKSHYETLGVDKTATADTIKRAYRKKAKESHPDIGGDENEMQALTVAYSVLKDNARRAHYDETGEDSQQSFDMEVKNLVLQVFNEAIQKNASHCLNAARKMLNEKQNEFKAQRSQMMKERQRLKGKQKKIKVRVGENLFDLIIEQGVAGITVNLDRLEHAMKVFTAAIKMLDEYESSEEEERVTATTQGFFRVGAFY